MTKLQKQVVRSHILEKLKEVTCLELADLAFKYDLHPFDVAECFEHEVWRVEKLFCFPEYPEQIEE